MADNSHQGFGTESPDVTSPTFPRQPTPELQWDPTMFVDFVANKWKLQPADRKELHEFAKVSLHHHLWTQRATKL